MRSTCPIPWVRDAGSKLDNMRTAIQCLWQLMPLVAMVREIQGKESFTVFRNTVDKEDFETIGGAILNETGTGSITALTICMRRVEIVDIPDQNA